ncbi:MAG: hypothetical protein NZL91_08825 [Thermoflexales bacterium]|nr:hypothetical protein [Thermoflexales bacterium]MCS7323992.1 hypothetical protein [Thermoflexales bacterium]MCX7939430.1 hypothetical protein [Thermoflexales bacterium]MDW8052932.1 flavoprotein [Anaerolineae bacterium]MDW8291583.1 flavoprotein [Anaerolineae bacterium]
MLEVIYLMVSGAVTAHRAAEVAAGLAARAAQVLVVPTPNAARVISPYALQRTPAAHVVESYFDARILPRPTPAPVVFAPCTFNSLNKLAAGVADNLALAITAEMIGFGQPVVVAVSVNQPLWRHPAARAAVATLRSWGVHVVEPVWAEGDYTLAPSEAILLALDQALKERQ